MRCESYFEIETLAKIPGTFSKRSRIGWVAKARSFDVVMASLFCPYTITKTCPCNIQRFFTAVKMKKIDKKKYNFLIFAQNIDCGYTLEPPQ